MSSNNSNLQKARKLINNRRYRDARRILEAMPGDPTAAKWLMQLNQKSLYNNVSSSSNLAPMLLGLGLLVLLVVGGIGAVLFISQQQQNSIVIPTEFNEQAAVVQLTPQNLLCDAQGWYNANAATINPFFASTSPNESLDVPVSPDINGLRAQRDVIANQQVAPCLQDLQTNMVAAMDAVINLQENSILQVRAPEEIVNYTSEQLREYTNRIADVLDTQAVMLEDLNALNIAYDTSAINANDVIVRYQEPNNEDCDGARWFLNELIAFSLVVTRATPIVTNIEQQPDFNEARSVVRLAQQEYRRVDDSPTQDCVRIAKGDLLTALNRIAQTLQYYVEGDLVQTYVAINEFEVERQQFITNLRRLDGLGLIDQVLPQPTEPPPPSVPTPDPAAAPPAQ